MNRILLLPAAALLAVAATLSVPAPATQAAATTTAAVPRCHSAELRARYRATDNGAGHRFGKIVLTNVSGHRCRTGGFGGLSYVGYGNGTQVGAPADRVGATTSFVLRPGQRAVSRVDETVAANYPRATCRPHPVDGFRVYVPNTTHSQFIAHRTVGCRNSAVHLISHTAYRKRT